jgi:hypothetical protein
MLAAYGAALGSGAGLSYTEWYALWLNLDRARYQRACEVAIGLNVALSASELPRAYYDGACPLEEQVQDAYEEGNMDRAMARQFAKRGKGGR